MLDSIASGTTIHGAGQRKGRFRFGCVLRSTSTQPVATTKAKSVPMLHISATSPIGVKPAIAATVRPTISVMMCGEPYFGCTLHSPGGIRPSRDMAKKARVWA